MQMLRIFLIGISMRLYYAANPTNQIKSAQFCSVFWQSVLKSTVGISLVFKKFSKINNRRTEENQDGTPYNQFNHRSFHVCPVQRC